LHQRSIAARSKLPVSGSGGGKPRAIKFGNTCSNSDSLIPRRRAAMSRGTSRGSTLNLITSPPLSDPESPGSDLGLALGGCVFAATVCRRPAVRQAYGEATSLAGSLVCSSRSTPSHGNVVASAVGAALPARRQGQGRAARVGRSCCRQFLDQVAVTQRQKVPNMTKMTVPGIPPVYARAQDGWNLESVIFVIFIFSDAVPQIHARVPCALVAHDAQVPHRNPPACRRLRRCGLPSVSSFGIDRWWSRMH
jgi:hypothetical protein